MMTVEELIIKIIIVIIIIVKYIYMYIGSVKHFCMKIAGVNEQ